VDRFKLQTNDGAKKWQTIQPNAANKWHTAGLMSVS